MKIQKNVAVMIDYTLKDDEGTVLDSSTDGDPLGYIQGVGMLVPGLEKEMEGKIAGDEFSVCVAPSDGYGEYDEELIFDVPKDRFQGDGEVAEGLQVQAQREDGSVQVLSVVSVGQDNVTLNGNHPLAGKTLNFDIEVKEVREATEEELDHGHVH